jgi:hypothetical protein
VGAVQPAPAAAAHHTTVHVSQPMQCHLHSR